MEQNQDVSLPYNDNFQLAIIGYCFKDYKFYQKCKKMLKPSWFTKSARMATIFEQMQKFSDTQDGDSGLAPRSAQELMNQDFFLSLDDKEAAAYKEVMERCILEATKASIDIQNIKQKLTGFIRLCLFKESINGITRQFKSLGFEETYQWTKKRILDIQDASFEDDASVLTFENPLDWLKEESLENRNAISTGNINLDLALGGGLFKGETTAIMAPVNSGKTTMMITIARHALRQNKKVLWITHEDNPQKLRRKMMSAIFGVKKETLLNPENFKDANFCKLMNQMSEFLSQHLVYLPYSKIGKMYIEDVADFIEKQNTIMKHTTGRGFDLIVDDYPKKLKTKNRTDLYRAEIAEVYDVFNQIAIEMDLHCFLAIQTNREGMKQNNGKVRADHLIGMDLVDESYGIAQNMGNIISLNRSFDDKFFNIVKFNIAKSRNDMTDIAIVSRTNYACSLTHGDANMFDSKWVFDYYDKGKQDFVKKNWDLSSLVTDLKMHGTDEKIHKLASYGKNDNKLIDTGEAHTILSRIERGELTDQAAYQDFHDKLLGINRSV